MALLAAAAALLAARAAYPEMDLVKLPQINGAACLDGSPPAYWFVEGCVTADCRAASQPANLNAPPEPRRLSPDAGVSAHSAATTKFYINFEGGGWCTSLDSCYDRAYVTKRKGSSVGLPDPFNLIDLMKSWVRAIISIHFCEVRFVPIFQRFCKEMTRKTRQGNWYFSNRTDDGN